MSEWLIILLLVLAIFALVILRERADLAREAERKRLGPIAWMEIDHE